MTPIRYRIADVDGFKVFYREAGSAGAPKLLLLHGFPSASHMFRDLIPLLADRFHIVAPDLPGFGQSDMPPREKFSYTFDNIARVIDRFTEVIGLDRSFDVAFAKSQLGAGAGVPRAGSVFVSVRDADKPRIVDTMKFLADLGFKIQATGGTQRFLVAAGVPAQKINKVSEGRPHVVDAIKNGSVQLVFNTTEGAQALADSRSLRRAALLHHAPYYTTLAGAIAAAQGIKAYISGDLEVRALQDYFP